ncbi:MAG: sensor histidine kinase [Candidatus Nanopelagicales bacterium]
MKKFRPISLKITIGILVPLSLLLSITLAFSRWSVTEQVRDRVDLEILQQLNELELLATTGINPNTGESFQTSDSLLEIFLSRRISNENETMFSMIDSMVTFRSPGESTLRVDQDATFLDTVDQIEIPTLDTYVSDVGELRYGVYPILGLDTKVGRLVVVTNLDKELDSTNILFRNLSLGLFIFFAMTGIILSVIVKRLLSPIAELTSQAQKVNKDNFIRQLKFETARVDDEITQLSQEFNNMLSRLESSFIDQQRFIDDAGHELRTPLTILKGHIELMQREGFSEQSLMIIEDEVNRMTRLVQDLQSLTKATQPNFVQFSSFSADVFIKEVQEKAQSIYSNPIEITEYVESQIRGDKQRLTQALLQLIENAVKYSPVGSIITFGMQVVDDDIVLFVKDRGSGISDEAKSHVFSRFFQVDNTHSAHDSGGVGLGLSIVKAIVDAHHGSIRILDNHPQGTIFEIRIPQDRRLM